MYKRYIMKLPFLNWNRDISDYEVPTSVDEFRFETNYDYDTDEFLEELTDAINDEFYGVVDGYDYELIRIEKIEKDVL